MVLEVIKNFLCKPGGTWLILSKDDKKGKVEAVVSFFFVSLFHEDRMRLGNDNLKKCVFCLPFRSPFAIFVAL